MVGNVQGKGSVHRYRPRGIDYNCVPESVFTKQHAAIVPSHPRRDGTIAGQQCCGKRICVQMSVRLVNVDACLVAELDGHLLRLGRWLEEGISQALCHIVGLGTAGVNIYIDSAAPQESAL